MKKFRAVDNNENKLQLCYELNESSISKLSLESESQIKKDIETRSFQFYINHENIGNYKELINDVEYAKYVKKWFLEYMSIVRPLPIDYDLTTLPMILHPMRTN